ncbi:MAG: hypothetical protein ACI4XL_10270 [Bacillus sp. (in: firmicutes)]
MILQERNYYITIFRTFSNRKITMKCGKDPNDVLNKVKEFSKSTDLLGPVSIQEVFYFESGIQHPYQFIFNEKQEIIGLEKTSETLSAG